MQINVGLLNKRRIKLLFQISQHYSQFQAWYTDAMIEHIFPRLTNSEYGSPEVLLGLQAQGGDEFFDQPSFIVSIWILSTQLLRCICSSATVFSSSEAVSSVLLSHDYSLG